MTDAVDPVTKAAITLLRALTDGDKFDRYNRQYATDLAAAVGTTLHAIKQLPPVINGPYDTKYKKQLQTLLEWEFCDCSQSVITTTAEACNYDLVRTRTTLRDDTTPRMRTPRHQGGYLTGQVEQCNHPALAAYVVELKRTINDDRVTRMTALVQQMHSSGLTSRMLVPDAPVRTPPRDAPPSYDEAWV